MEAVPMDEIATDGGPDACVCVCVFSTLLLPSLNQVLQRVPEAQAVSSREGQRPQRGVHAAAEAAGR